MQAYPLPDGNMQVLKGSEGWFVGTGVGAQLYVGDSDGKQDFGYRMDNSNDGSAFSGCRSTCDRRFYQR